LRKLPYREVIGLFFVLPLVVPSGSMVHFWRSVFGLNGAVNRLFFSDAPINWLDSEYAILVILIIFMWKNAGFNVVLYQAGLNIIPRDYYESAELDGAGRSRLFWHITLVYLLPTGFMVLIMSLLAAFRSFREIYLLAGSHPYHGIYTLMHFMNNMFAALNYQRLAPAAHMLAAGIAVVVVAMMYVQRRVNSHD